MKGKICCIYLISILEINRREEENQQSSTVFSYLTKKLHALLTYFFFFLRENAGSLPQILGNARTWAELVPGGHQKLNLDLKEMAGTQFFGSSLAVSKGAY